MSVSIFAELPILPSDSIYYSWSIFSRLFKNKSLRPSSLLQNHIRNSEVLHFNVNCCSKSCQCLPRSLFTRLIYVFPSCYEYWGLSVHSCILFQKITLDNRGHLTQRCLGQPTANDPGRQGYKDQPFCPTVGHLMVPFMSQRTYHGAHYYVLLNLLPNIYHFLTILIVSHPSSGASLTWLFELPSESMFIFP